MALESDVVTWTVVGTVMTGGGVLFAAINWLNKTFQTREAARAQMKAIDEKFDRLDKRFELTDAKLDKRFQEQDQKMEGIHTHIRHLNGEMNDRMKSVQVVVDTNQRATIEIATAVSYMKGKIEQLPIFRNKGD